MRPSITRSRRTARHVSRVAAGRARLRAAREDGFTLFEVLIAAVVLVVGLLSTLSLLDASLKASASTRAHEGATGIAREILEDARTLAYSTIGPNSITPELQAMHGLENVSGESTWKIVRRGVTYTVVVKECAIDDPKDGSGKHENALKENPYCKDAGEAEGTADSQPEDLKRITAEVTWTAIGRKPSVKEVETLTAAGESPGLSASELKLAEPKAAVPTAPVIVAQPKENKLVFSVQSPAGTAAMEWSLDGVRQTNEPAFVKGTEWQFSWLIPLPEVSDGAYKVTVQAVDETGVYGPPVSITVTLIRTTPAAPKVKYGGFNEVFVGGVKKKIVELLWEPNTERNVIGYRTFEPAGALACPESLSALSLEASCADLLATVPEPSASNLTYSVAALYRKAEGETLSASVSEGPAAKFTISKTILTPNNVSEGAEKGLEGKKEEEGVRLKWKEPSGGPKIAFYRVYRGSQNITGRYAVVAPSTTEFLDTKSTIPHKYWVTAVSETMTESAFCCGTGLEL